MGSFFIGEGMSYTLVHAILNSQDPPAGPFIRNPGSLPPF